MEREGPVLHCVTVANKYIDLPGGAKQGKFWVHIRDPKTFFLSKQTHAIAGGRHLLREEVPWDEIFQEQPSSAEDATQSSDRAAAAPSAAVGAAVDPRASADASTAAEPAGQPTVADGEDVSEDDGRLSSASSFSSASSSLSSVDEPADAEAPDAKKAQVDRGREKEEEELQKAIRLSLESSSNTDESQSSAPWDLDDDSGAESYDENSNDENSDEDSDESGRRSSGALAPAAKHALNRHVRVPSDSSDEEENELLYGGSRSTAKAAAKEAAAAPPEIATWDWDFGPRGWKRFSGVAMAELNRGWREFQLRPQDNRITLSAEQMGAPGSHYTIDFAGMTQTNDETG